MKWKMQEARPGDIVRVALRGGIYHFGIFVSEDEVIQFGLPPTPNRRSEDVEVLSSHVSDFLVGGFLEVGCPEGKEARRRKSPKETVAMARSRIGEKGYDILHNNCEHFANECFFGEKFSSMTDSIREKMRAIPIVHVYVAKFPFPVETEKILPPARAAEIESCSNADVRRAKYYVWKLLENALMRTFGLKIEKLDLKRTNSGKWQCSECYFSLSHSGDFVAVAVSRKPIGVDVEKWEESRFTVAVANKIATRHEQEEIARLEESARGTALNALWTKKEAIFKLIGEGSFQPKCIQTSDYTSITKAFQHKSERYIITVASEDAAKSIFRCQTELEFINF